MYVVYKEIYELQYDVKVMISHAERYKQDADRGLQQSCDNVNSVAKGEDWSKDKQVESLFHYLHDAKMDIDRLRDEMKEVLDKLSDLIDTVEYEEAAAKIRRMTAGG